MKDGKYVLALDQGTTSSRAVLFDQNGRVVRTAQQEFTQFFPDSGWVEHDAEEIWAIQRKVMLEAAADVSAQQLAAIGITNQRETTVVWDRKTGKPVGRAIVWQCRRTSDMCERLKREGLESVIRDKTGLVLDPYFSGTKLKWMLDQQPGLRERAMRGDVLFGTIDSWLIWNLTDGSVHVTDYTNAARTMLFNIHTLDWDEDLLKALDIPRSMLPEVRSSSEIYGYAKWPDGGRVPVAGAAGDQHAALFGQACFEPGMVKNTYGTGCFILMQTGSEAPRSSNGLLTTIAWGRAGKVEYALEGSVFTAGAVVQWLRDELQIISRASDTEQIAASVDDTGGVYFVPAFTGLGAPYWDPHARGLVSGLTRGTSRAQLVRAALESIAYQSKAVIDAMEQDAGMEIRELRVDGGAAQNQFLMQFQADLLDTQVTRSQVQETTALGAAYLAGLATGLWDDLDQIRHMWGADRKFLPRMEAARRDELYDGWKEAVRLQIER